ncbi:MAG: hypothetical protein PHG08_06835 [Bacilli bacterium]|jgi:hypothetical protein|nr:hypothetical protein [Bacilli bacterium]HHU24370.1 hypothetical protein [Acholeplasmataceae bacterium]
MAKKQKLRNFIVALFFSLIIISTLTHQLDYQKTFHNTLFLWVKYIIPSLVPLYIVGNILAAYPFLSFFIYPLFKNIFNFESEKSCSLFLLSFIIGQPTITLLIKQALTEQAISNNEANRLMRFTSHLSPLFIIAIASSGPFPERTGYLLVASQIFASCLLAVFSRGSKIKLTSRPLETDISFSYLIEECPLLLLKILMIMIIVSLLRFPFFVFFTRINDYLVGKYLLDLFEITTGLASLIKYPLTLTLLTALVSFTISLSGLCIIFQTIYAMKKTSLKLASYVYFRIIHGLISGAVCLVFIFLF